MQIRRWWLAIVATLLTPWIGPHVDRYVPVGWVLLRAGAEGADRGFWGIAAIGLGGVFLAWLALFSGLAAWLARRRRDHGRADDAGTP
ncbi:hypothetical protein [Azospira restricta]|uniref:Transmembrane protein n=1 Tax=Azospira restricta TaxID=404405 RepID=A0A974PVJ7_9RHOO|nr:hypothetical protein [Azospira restricta]QRJ62322.1 hypothetical protein IWH25_11010 [Azospira restricta]